MCSWKQRGYVLGKEFVKLTNHFLGDSLYVKGDKCLTEFELKSEFELMSGGKRTLVFPVKYSCALTLQKGGFCSISH